MNNSTTASPATWAVKCDDCKATIRMTEDVRESYAGGICAECRAEIQSLGDAAPDVVLAPSTRTTRRERLEGKLERRQEWEAGRRGKAAGLRAQNDRFRGDWAFNTQPGHIPERARAIARDEKSFEHLAVAEHHAEKAAGHAHRHVRGSTAGCSPSPRRRVAAGDQA